jgi:deoxyribose-phosphate aldolase
MTKNELAKFIDHTLLKPNSTREQFKVLCQEALEYNFASVCVLPFYVDYAYEILQKSSVDVCTVVGFPLGVTYTSAKLSETGLAIASGAREIDMVINISQLINGDFKDVYNDIFALADFCHNNKSILKVIIETCLLSEQNKIDICKIVSDAGADFIKTSTGFSTGGATIKDIELMKANVSDNVKIKASGGIRELGFCLDLIHAGADRIGTSSGVSLVNSL